MRFVSSESEINEAEEEFWESLRSAMGPQDNGVAYQRYPIIDNTADYDREADFVLLLKDLGIVVIECKGYQIDHIDRIEGSRWELSGISQDAASPYTQARDQGFRLMSHFTKEPTLMDDRGNCKISLNFLVTLPNITREEWEQRGFDDIPSSPEVILGDELTPQKLREKLHSQPGESLREHEYDDALSVLRGSQPISGNRTSIDDPETKGEVLEAAERGLEKTR